MITPAKLSKGDLILLVSPAKSIEQSYLTNAVSLLNKQGFRVEIGSNANCIHGYFAGKEAERFQDFQWAIDHPEAKAIWCARGGYGSIRLIQKLQWASMLTHPKWLLGFSDITNFHCKLYDLGIESIHGTMPLNFKSNSEQSLASAFSLILKNENEVSWKTEKFISNQETQGILIGGNLSIIYSLLGTPLCPDFTNKILFLEDLSEQWYHIDRMFQSLALHGVFERISALVIGGFTNMKDTDPSTHFTLESIIESAMFYRKIPVVFNAPIGHIDDNQAVIIGRKTSLKINDQMIRLTQV